jgi:hypothetical protein
MKIKFLDTQEVLEVTTPWQVVNTKVRVSGPEESQQIQLLLNEMGIGWGDKQTPIQHLDKPFLFIYHWKALAWHNDDDHFRESHAREFSFISPTSETTDPDLTEYGCQFGKTDKLCNIDCECVFPADPETRELVRDIEIVQQGEQWVKEQDRINSGWISVEDRPLVEHDVLTEDGMNEFLAAVPTNKGWWIRHCVFEDNSLCVVGDDYNEYAGWEITDVTHWQPIPEPPKTLNS